VEHTIINLTPHKLNILCGSEAIEVDPQGFVPRVGFEVAEEKQVQVQGKALTVQSKRLGEVTGLEEVLQFCQPGNVVVVSALLAQHPALAGKVCSPGDLVRNEQGQPIGCNGLASW
jgi:regulator of RNase E activity RraA